MRSTKTSIKNEKGFVVILTVLIVSAVLVTFMATLLNTVSSASKSRATIRRSFSSDGVFENLAQMIVSGYELKKQIGAGACPAGTNLVTLARGTAPSLVLCISSTCITNPVNASTPICFTAGSQNPILTFQVDFKESPAVAWLTDQVESRWLSRDLQGLPKAVAQGAFKNSLPTAPGAPAYAPAGPAPLASTMCEDPAGQEFKCLIIKVCLTRSPCTGANDVNALYQRIGFNP